MASPLALPGALPFTLRPPKGPKGVKSSAPHKVKSVPQDGVRTFLPFTLRHRKGPKGLPSNPQRPRQTSDHPARPPHSLYRENVRDLFRFLGPKEVEKETD